MYVASPIKVFSFLIDIFFSSELYMKVVKSTLIIVNPFSAQINLGILNYKTKLLWIIYYLFLPHAIIIHCPMQLYKLYLFYWFSNKQISILILNISIFKVLFNVRLLWEVNVLGVRLHWRPQWVFSLNFISLKAVRRNPILANWFLYLVWTWPCYSFDKSGGWKGKWMFGLTFFFL